jgi:hypothetical protein
MATLLTLDLAIGVRVPASQIYQQLDGSQLAAFFVCLAITQGLSEKYSF